jgi:bifunctional ADP-heptose synthase (sugar kinase/adenylyltransferase)
LYCIQNINFKNLLVTLGAEGNFIFDGNKSQILHLNSQILNADVCGAGDTVIAVASLGLACGFSLEQIAELSNKAGFCLPKRTCTTDNNYRVDELMSCSILKSYYLLLITILLTSNRFHRIHSCS